MKALAREVRRKLRLYRVSAAQWGLGTTLYWAVVSLVKPLEFVVLARDLSTGVLPRPTPEGARFEVWNAAGLRDWRRGRQGLPTDFFQDEVDGVETCAVALVHGDVAGVMWIYGQGDASRVFDLREREAEVNNVYVLGQYRDRGLFKGLLAFGAQWLLQNGYRTVYAVVLSTNTPSLRAFRAVGFQEIGRVRHVLFYRPKFRGRLPEPLAHAGEPTRA